MAKNTKAKADKTKKEEKKNKGYRAYYRANDKTLKIDVVHVEIGSKSEGGYKSNDEWGELEDAKKRLEVYKENYEANRSEVEKANEYKRCLKFIEEYEKTHKRDKGKIVKK